MDSLDKAATVAAFALLAYVVMPDHVHVLAAGLNDDSNAIRFMQQFKQRSGFAYRSISGTALWQQSFFDRVLRRSESAEEVARYIAENARRAGLVDEDEGGRFSEEPC